MATDGFLLSRRDLDFQLYEWLHVESLTARPGFSESSREMFDALLDLSQNLATDKFAPHLKASDRHEPVLVDERVELIPEIGQALDALRKSGLIGAAMNSSDGGAQLPATVAAACLMWFQAANIATSAYAALTIGNANLLLAYGSKEQVDTWVTPMSQGRFFGTMCLSEPGAGSSLAELTTCAVPQEDGTYRLTGNKMWISAGDHELTENIVHLVLAKLPDAPAGVKGISLFVVPKYLLEADGSIGERNDVVVAGLNHKMGYRGTVNTLLNLGEGRHQPGGRPGAVGYLVGEAHHGLGYMFHMMNESRISVGAGAMAIGYTGYLKSLDYARHRVQGRRSSDRGASHPQVPIVEHADVRRMLLAQKAYVEGALALILYSNMLVDESRTAETSEQRQAASQLLETLTPISKAWPSQWCLEANNLAIQVHGGYGYTRDYDVEQHYRDNRLNLIHEGTNGIQALDLLGRKVVMDNGSGLAALVTVIIATTERAGVLGGEWQTLADSLGSVVGRIQDVTAALWAAGDIDVTLANASVYLDALGHTVVAWLWLEQGLATNGQDGDFYEGKRQAMRYFFRHELPKVGIQLDLLATLDRTTLDMSPAWL